MRLRFLLHFCLLSVIAFPALADQWTPEDLLLAESAGGLEVSPDGKLVVWVKSAMDREKGETVSNLVLKNLAENFEIQLTRGSDNNSSPKFAPDGRRIAFVSSRRPAAQQPEGGSAAPSGGSQIWLLDLRGGEPWQLTRLEKGVRAFEWLDNDTLLIAATEDSSLYEQQVKERKDTSQVVDDEQHAAPVRLFRFDLKTRTAKRITANTDRIERVAVSRDGRWAVTTHNRSLRYTYDQTIPPVTYLHDLAKGTSQQLFADGKLLPGNIEWTPDSRGFYFSAAYGTHPKFRYATIQLLYYYDVTAAKTTQVALDWENGLGSGGFTVLPDGFVALLANGARPRPARYTREGDTWKRAWIESEHAGHIFGVNAAKDGKTVIYRYSTASLPAQWYAATIDGAALRNAKQFTDLNAGWKKKPLAKSELVYWKGARNEQVEGILSYPHNYEPGKKYPLVVMIHGGPASADLDEFSERWGYPVQLMAQRNAFVFRPNYHGSSQYGLKWVESIGMGSYNDLEWEDVEKGVDSLIAKGLVDADKLGVMGWSNGSIITIELTTRTTRYKVASAGAGDVNWISDWGNAVFGEAFDHYYFGTTPIENPQLYLRKSPLFRMGKVVTPTIIFFGTEDKQVPTEQGWQHYRALQQLGKTDVKFVLFPGEAHGPRKYVHQRRKLVEELAWFDKYLFKTGADVNESLKPESPLAAALKRKAMGRTPDVVLRGGIEVGRFEVTRAQYAAFDSAYKFEPGTENYPASGISFDQAKAYCEWLSKTTGAKYRLGSEEEMQGLLKAGRNENTLDYWAGYTLNPDDARKLASLVEGLGAGALLRPVGSFAGSGEDPLFDLGGNVAEWTVDKSGAGKVLGGSADRPADAKADGKARPEYVGFRVVRDPK